MFGFNPNKIQRSPSSTEDSEKNDKEEGKESKKEKIVLEIDGQKIEGEKYYFEYPKHVQEETGILGYVKYKMEKSQFNDNFKMVKEVCSLLSNGNFPGKTYNHRIQGDDDWYEGNKEELMKERFLLGKITNIAGKVGSLKGRMNRIISVLIDDDGNISFVGDIIQGKDGVYHTLELNGTKKDIKVTNSVRLEGIPFSCKELTENELKQLMKDKIFITTMQGLYTYYGSIFGTVESMILGFDNQESPFREYLQYADKLYSKIPQDLIIEKNVDSLKHLLNFNTNEKKEKFDSMIPVITGNIHMPEFRWGHAKYAVIPTEKNFNFLIIDHLPKPKDTK